MDERQLRGERPEQGASAGTGKGFRALETLHRGIAQHNVIRDVQGQAGGPKCAARSRHANRPPPSGASPISRRQRQARDDRARLIIRLIVGEGKQGEHIVAAQLTRGRSKRRRTAQVKRSL